MHAQSNLHMRIQSYIFIRTYINYRYYYKYMPWKESITNNWYSVYAHNTVKQYEKRAFRSVIVQNTILWNGWSERHVRVFIAIFLDWWSLPNYPLYVTDAAAVEEGYGGGGGGGGGSGYGCGGIVVQRFLHRCDWHSCHKVTVPSPKW